MAVSWVRIPGLRVAYSHCVMLWPPVAGGADGLAAGRKRRRGERRFCVQMQGIRGRRPLAVSWVQIQGIRVAYLETGEGEEMLGPDRGMRHMRVTHSHKVMLEREEEGGGARRRFWVGDTRRLLTPRISIVLLHQHNAVSHRDAVLPLTTWHDAEGHRRLDSYHVIL